MDWIGRTLLFLASEPDCRSRVFGPSTRTARAALRKLESVPPDATDPKLSPDGRWLAYSSRRSGSSLVCLQDFPRGEMRVPVSNREGSYPEWNRNGRELFCLALDGTLIFVPVREENGSFFRPVCRNLSSKPISLAPIPTA